MNSLNCLKEALDNFDAKDEEAMSRAAKIREALPAESKSNSLARVIELQHYFVDKTRFGLLAVMDGLMTSVSVDWIMHLPQEKNVNILVMDTEGLFQHRWTGFQSYSDRCYRQICRSRKTSE